MATDGGLQELQLQRHGRAALKELLVGLGVVVQPLVQHVVVALEELNDLTMVDRNRTVPVVIDGLPCLLCGS